MRFLQPTPPPYDPLKWRALPFAQRARQVCVAWAEQGYGAPAAIYGLYLAKIGLFIGAWLAFCATSPSLGTPESVADWWLHPLAFQKAILWSMLFEMLGLGCGSGPLTGRYLPPLGGVLYFMRPGTLTHPLRPGMPILGGDRRTCLDVALYAAVVSIVAWQLLSPEVSRGPLLAVLGLMVPLGLSDRTVLLAARGEHYLVTMVVFVFAGNWIAGAKAVQLALWFWAGVSKLNHHFPAVVGVMTSNGPLTSSPRLRRAMYRSFPDDLRPSKLATALGHGGTALELAVPIVLYTATGPWGLGLGLVLMVALHAYISSNVPMGVPLEWNVMVLYGGFALFMGHPEVGLGDLDAPLLGGALGVVLLGVPLLGNVRPDLVSFLPAMRYYAGNWANSVWLLRRGSEDKLRHGLVMSSPWIYHQLAPFYDESTAEGSVGKVMAFRLMHLHGRVYGPLITRAVPDLAAVHWLDGELVAGMVRGWNFGDGHLHDARLLAQVQAACGMAPGELVCVMVESQPMGAGSLSWEVWDAALGKVNGGTADVGDLRARQPWETRALRG